MGKEITVLKGTPPTATRAMLTIAALPPHQDTELDR